MFQTKFAEKIKHIVYVQYFVSPENRIVYETFGKNVADSVRPQMTIQCGACALHAG
jgi:hypothetical protein